MKTLEALLKEGTEILKKAAIEEAGLDAWLLLEYVTGRNRAWYFAHSDQEAEPEIQTKYLALCEKRGQHIPLQHLTGSACFMGYEFLVNEHVLIPRQDTEILAEEALRLLKGKCRPRLLDMCTGSGCILLSLLKEMPDARGVGADLSKEALQVAERNAVQLQVQDRADFVCSNLFSSDYFAQNSGKELPEYDMLISNPPYIAAGEIEKLMDEVRLHDPRMALDGGEDGLYFYRRIIRECHPFLKPSGWLLFEIGYDQGTAVSGLMEQAGLVSIEIKKDLAGLDRVVMGRKP